MLKYTIILDGTATQVDGKDVYKIDLDWSNNNFKEVIGNRDQQFYLYRVIYNADGTYTTQRVKKLSGTDGDHTDEDLDKMVNQTTYTDYIAMTTSGQEIIYVVQGSDEPNDFLDLMFSNRKAFLIPGTDKQERLVLGIGSIGQSKYDPKVHKNYYSNVIPMHNGVGTNINKTFLSVGGSEPSTFVFYRKPTLQSPNVDVIARAVLKSSKTKSNESIKGTDGVTRRYNSTYYVFEVTMENQDNGGGFTTTPTTIECRVAPVDYTDDLGYTVKVDEVDFAPFIIRDNFSVEIPEANDHQTEYVYQVRFVAAKPFIDGDDNTKEVYSNEKQIFINKSDLKAYGSVTYDEVNGDVQHQLEVFGGARYDMQVQGAPESDIYQYRVQKWTVPMSQRTLDDPKDYAANKTNYYEVSSPYTADDAQLSIEQGERKWARFLETKDLAAGEYAYMPVVESFVPESNYRDQARNTYGAPIRTLAVGKLDVKPYYAQAEDAGTDMALMSDWKWKENNTWYSYYNILLDIKALDIPAGYQLYKLRAWRHVDGDILAEQLATRGSRTAPFSDAEGKTWYLYEEMDFGNALNTEGTEVMSKDALYDSQNKVGKHYVGQRPTSLPRPDGRNVFDPEMGEWAYGENQEAAILNERRATFGAQRLATTTGDPAKDVGTLNLLSADFVVRAYFTPVDNPVIVGSSSVAPIYVLGNKAGSGDWDPTQALATLYSADGVTYMGNVTVNDTGDGVGYFSFTKALATNGWDDINDGNTRFGWTDNMNESYWITDATQGTVINLTTAQMPGSIRAAAGTYSLVVTMQDGVAKTLTVNKNVSGRAPRRAGTASDYSYYIAEGTAHFEIKASDGVITGLHDLNAGKQVLGVMYYNAVGMASAQPWSGVNIAVTRYSDGTTTTRKVVR